MKHASKTSHEAQMNAVARLLPRWRPRFANTSPKTGQAESGNSGDGAADQNDEI